MKLGDKIIWAHDFTKVELCEGEVTKMQGDTCWVNGQHKAEDCLYKAYAWPAAAKNKLLAILTERARLKRAFDDSMKLVYELRNAVTRGEIV